MKLPSITQLSTDYSETFGRFPLTMISAVIGTTAAIILVEQDGPSESFLYKVLLASVLSLGLLTALKLVGERESDNSSRALPLQMVGLILIVGYGFLVPADLPRQPMYHLFRFFAFGIGCCLLVSFLPFRHKGQRNGFWQFNQIVAFRLVLAGAFGTVLFVGLALALAALDNLFGMDIPGERYFELWILIVGLFVVPYVLSGIPKSLRDLDEVTDYPRALKVLGQYVLAPLVLVYSVILYAYIAKIMVTWSWPQGWVGRLILGFSATGILALFVLDPLREKAETLWLQKAARWYYIVLLPLVVVLFLALWQRIADYGLTESRYIGLALDAWLAFIAGYFLLSRAKSIKMIPVSLCVLTFLISFGPWGMFAVSEQSQVQRLKSMLVADSILVDGIVHKASSPVSEDHEIQISAILNYLHQVHGYSAIESWFEENLQHDSTDTRNRYKSAAYAAECLGVKYNPYGVPGLDTYFSVFIDPETPVSISGYNHMVRAGHGGAVPQIYVGKKSTISEITTTPDSVVVQFFTEGEPTDSLMIPIRPLIDRIASIPADNRRVEMSGEQATLIYETDTFRTKVVLLEAYCSRKDSTIEVSSFDALILYSRKDGK